MSIRTISFPRYLFLCLVHKPRVEHLTPIWNCEMCRPSDAAIARLFPNPLCPNCRGRGGEPIPTPCVIHEDRPY